MTFDAKQKPPGGANHRAVLGNLYLPTPAGTGAIIVPPAKMRQMT
jgi:hypothetical protein